MIRWSNLDVNSLIVGWSHLDKCSRDKTIGGGYPQDRIVTAPPSAARPGTAAAARPWCWRSGSGEAERRLLRFLLLKRTISELMRGIMIGVTGWALRITQATSGRSGLDAIFKRTTENIMTDLLLLHVLVGLSNFCCCLRCIVLLQVWIIDLFKIWIADLQL